MGKAADGLKKEKRKDKEILYLPFLMVTTVIYLLDFARAKGIG